MSQCTLQLCQTVAPARVSRGQGSGADQSYLASPIVSAKEEQLTLMERGYRGAGGLTSGDEVASRMSEHCDQAVSKLARLIVNREIVSFEWHSRILVPMFQFKLSDMSLRMDVAEILLELSGAVDDWDVALWFVQPNQWLLPDSPLQTLNREPSAVLHAARAYRFIASW